RPGGHGRGVQLRPAAPSPEPGLHLSHPNGARRPRRGGEDRVQPRRRGSGGDPHRHGGGGGVRTGRGRHGGTGVQAPGRCAVAAGVATTVVVYRAIKAHSGARFGRAEVRAQATTGHGGTTAMQWCMPYGVLTPASWMAFNATRYMHTYGVTNEDFGRAVVQFR